ncbi:MAG: hypothetical protein J5898_07250 [Lachnospiraceae bacterium]|nr:hypothetical protein [Lachnospiraceae bacterium]MBP5223616.1 hypothetical protein [Lachnospiraceae bacterium]
MKETTAKKYMNIPMEAKLYSRSYCRRMAQEIRTAESITGMSTGELSCEIFAHAYIYYNFRFVPKCLRGLRLFKSFYRSVENGVDLEDDGDKWYRKAAYRLIWFLPAFAI